MGSVNARFQLGVLLAIAAMLVLLPLAAIAASSDGAAIAAAEKAEDKGKPRKPPVFSPDRRNPEVEALKAEVQKLRAQVEKCSSGAHQ